MVMFAFIIGLLLGILFILSTLYAAMSVYQYKTKDVPPEKEDWYVM